MNVVTIQILGDDGSILFESKFRKFPFFMGRDREGDLYLDDKTCSKVHAAIEQRGDELWLVDQKSRNGSYTEEGEPIKEILIGNQFRVRLGNTWLKIEVAKVEEKSVTVLAIQEEFSASQIPPLLNEEEPFQAPRHHEKHSFEMESTPEPQPTPQRKHREAPITLAYEAIEAPITRKPLVSTYEPIPEDLLDKLITLFSGVKFLILALLVMEAPLLLIAPSSSSSRELQEMGVAILVGVLAVAFVFTVATSALAKLFRKDRNSSEIMHAYVSFFSLLYGGYSLVENSRLLWPGGSPVHFTSLLFMMLLCGLYLLFNLRWILNADKRILLGCFLGCSVLIAYQAMELPLESEARWKETHAKVDINLSPKSVPARFYVQTSQLMTDIDKSFKALEKQLPQQQQRKPAQAKPK